MSDTIKAILKNQEYMELLLEQLKGLTNVTCAYIDRLLSENEPRKIIRESQHCYACNNAIVTKSQQGNIRVVGCKLTVPCTGFSLKNEFSNSDEAKEKAEASDDIFSEIEKICNEADEPQPTKTYRDDFFDKFPNARKNVTGNPIYHWCHLYTPAGASFECDSSYECAECPMWNERMEGEK